MIAAFKTEIQQDWPQIENYVQQQMAIIAMALKKFTELYAIKQISTEQFQTDLQQVQSSVAMTLVTEAGLEQVIIAKALQTALHSVKSSINTVAGVAIL